MWLWHSSVPAILTYRLNRCLYLFFGKPYNVIRVLLWPIFFLFRLLGPVLDISYHADIGPGFKILHPTLGVLVSGKAVCGRGLVLTGGNWIASRKPTLPGDISIGDNVTLRANAMVLGPIRVGDGCVVGAGAVAVNDCPLGSVMVGIPALPARGPDP